MSAEVTHWLCCQIDVDDWADLRHSLIKRHRGNTARDSLDSPAGVGPPAPTVLMAVRPGLACAGE